MIAHITYDGSYYKSYEIDMKLIHFYYRVKFSREIELKLQDVLSVTFSQIFHCCTSEFSSLKFSITNCMENMSRLIKDLFIFQRKISLEI